MSAERGQLGSLKRPSRQGLPNQKSRAKAEEAKARRERPSMNGQMEKSGEEVASLFMGAVDRCGKFNRREKYDQRDWQVWERIQEQARQQWESFKAGNLCVNSVDSEEKGDRIDLTIDSGCAACALPVGVASAVGMQELDTAPQ